MLNVMKKIELFPTKRWKEICWLDLINASMKVKTQNNIFACVIYDKSEFHL